METFFRALKIFTKCYLHNYATYNSKKQIQKPPLISQFFPHHLFITLDKENLEPLALIPILLSLLRYMFGSIN